MSDDTRTHFVYTAWDSADRPLYVGCTKDFTKRIKQHRASKSPWLPYAVRFTMAGPYPKDQAFKLERERYVAIRPHFNWQPEHAAGLKHLHRIGFWGLKGRTRLRTLEMVGLDVTMEGRLVSYKRLLKASAVAA